MKRRQFLQYGALTPLLCRVPRAHAMPTTPKRLIIFHHPQGTVLQDFLPSGTTEHFEYSSITQPLDPFKEHITLVSGIDNIMPRYNEVSTAHPNANYTFLTGRPFLHQDPQRLTASGPTIEQVIAERISQNTPFERLDFAIGGPRSEGGILLPSESAYFWYGAEEPVAYFQDPSVALARIFGDQSIDPNVAYEQSSRRSAVLSQVLRNFDRFSNQLSGDDKISIQSHSNRVSQLLRRTSTTNTGCEAPSLLLPYGYDYTYDDDTTAELMIDILVTAMQCDYTRVSTLHFANSHDHRFEWLWEENGGPIIDRSRWDNWHAMVHADYQSGMEHVYKWYMKVLAKLLRTLSNRVDADGDNMLETSLVVSISEFSSGRHWHNSLPILLAGNRQYGGRWLDYMNGGLSALEESMGAQSSGYNMNQFLLTLLHHFGFDDDVFGSLPDGESGEPLSALFDAG
ncbi:MAG: DUF1552 domain-containing protein [Myxococcota bacterium]|nr:DUF1552 domain-containing protein [Myxococcota bacterium]